MKSLLLECLILFVVIVTIIIINATIEDKRDRERRIKEREESAKRREEEWKKEQEEKAKRKAKRNRKKRKKMKKIQILYVHGLNSDCNSTTGMNIEKILKKSFKDYEIVVSHPTFSKIADEAMQTLNEEIEKNNIDIVIGTSLGGFVTLNAHGPYKIVVNPVLHPSQTLLQLGESEEVAKTYVTYENELFRNETMEDKLAKMRDRLSTMGWFADNDTIVHDADEFKKYYSVCKSFHGEHRMNEANIRDIIVKSVKTWITLSDEGILDSIPIGGEIKF